jgi:hypothetical protein
VWERLVKVITVGLELLIRLVIFRLAVVVLELLA